MHESERDLRWIPEVQRIVHENPWFSVLHQSVRRPDGRASSYFTIHHATPAVGIVARRADRILLIRQHRFIVDEFVWAIPSGGVDPSETLQQAAERELMEEAGMRAAKLTHLLYYYPSYGCSDQRFELFLADEVVEAGNAQEDGEVIGSKWFSREELIHLIGTNGVVDGLSLVPLLYILFGLTPRNG